MIDQYYTWFTALKLPEVKETKLSFGHLQNAVLNDQIKTIVRSDKRGIPSTAFTREALQAYLNSEVCRRLIETITTARRAESVPKKITARDARTGALMKLRELRAEARASGFEFEEYLSLIGYSSQDIEEMINARTRPEGPAGPEEPVWGHEDQGEGEDGLADIQGLVGRLRGGGTERVLD